MMGLYILLMLSVVVVFSDQWFAEADQRRARYLRHYALPKTALYGLQQYYPQLSSEQLAQVEHGLLCFFSYQQASHDQALVPPSVAVAALWAVFAQDTSVYRQFCLRAFGKVYPPVAAAAMGEDKQQSQALSLTWALSCRDEVINPRTPSSLPLLFGLDAALEIRDGLRYRLDSTGLYAEGQRIAADNLIRDGEKNAVFCHNIAMLQADYDLNDYFDPQ